VYGVALLLVLEVNTVSKLYELDCVMQAFYMKPFYWLVMEVNYKSSTKIRGEEL
jgi:hypothetical protein